MSKQNYLPSIDPSSIIWDKASYEGNRLEYGSILLSLSKLMDEMETFTFLLSEELKEEMISNFPANLCEGMEGDLWAIVHQLYDFLSKIGSNDFTKNQDEDLESFPNQIKSHFNERTSIEVNYLLNYYHTDDTENKIYFSFENLWNETNELVTKSKKDKKHSCIIVDRENNFQEFIDSYLPKFEHKEKHDISEFGNKEAWKNKENGNEFISQLSCLLDDGSKSPQEILNERYDKFFGNLSYYGYDVYNKVYVVFRISGAGTNIYHAHDEYDINAIPQEVKNHFGVFKYD
ncbi:hypothetical protein [Flagellimonas sp.]|uniref:hypothetical protein n=1 Tax=Flagellimonas sp. TaxID=2058762 RepID=UPI003BA9A4BA